MKWSVNLTVLTSAQLDLLKLAMLDLGPTQSGFADRDYVSADDKYIGVAFSATVDLDGCSKSSEVAYKAGEVLKSRGVQYLSMFVRSVETGNTSIAACFSHGNIPRDHSSLGVFRDPPKEGT